MFSGLAGVDLDKCVNVETGEIAEWAILVVCAFNSYTERSPSGTGLRILFNAKLPGPGLNRTVRGMHVEIYDGGRYLTLTGHHIDGTPKTIEPRQEAASQFYQWILDGTEPKKQPTDRPVLDPNQKGKDLTDAEVMDCCLNSANGEKFEKLWDGDIGDYKDDTHPDGNPSRADAAMAGILCLDQSEKTVPGNPKPDEFSRWVGAEKDLLRDARKWADAFDDLGKTTQDRRIFAGRLLDQIKPILLQDGKRERRRLLLKLKQDTENMVIEASFMHEGIVSEGENTPDYSPSPVVSVNTNGDKAIQDETEQIEARKVAIRARFIEIQPYGCALFVVAQKLMK